MASAFAMLFFTLFSDGGPINEMLMQIGVLKESYQFLTNVWSTRGLVALMNFLMWFGNTTILLMAGMMGIDTSLFEAAEVDGATSTQVFFKITSVSYTHLDVYKRQQESISAGIETVNLRIYGIDRIMITTLTVLGLVINGGILYLDLTGA